jgi:HEAT repeat protein
LRDAAVHARAILDRSWFPDYGDYPMTPNRTAARAAAILLLIFARPAGACSCYYSDQNGFLTASSLPANAKGVVFLQKDPPRLFSSGHGAILAELPAPLSPADFIVREIGSDRVVPAVIEKLQALPRAGRQRYYRPRGIKLKTCFDGSISNSKACYQYGLDATESEDAWLQRQVARKTVIDVTEAAARGAGLFRITPKGGFVPGREYEFEYRGAKPGEEPGYPTVRVRIDREPLVLPVKGAVRLEAESPGRLEWVSVAAGGSCSERIPAQVQNLAYRAPDAFQPYLGSFLFFTQVSRDGQEFQDWHYQPTLCSQAQFGSSSAGHGKEIVYGLCGGKQRSGSTPVAKGLFGFLELDDTLYETPVLPLDLPQPDRQECEAKFASKAFSPDLDIESLRMVVCDPRAVFREMPEKQDEIIQNLFKLAKHSDTEVRRCTAARLGGVAWEENKLSNSDRAEVMSLLIGALSDPEASVRTAAANELERLRWWDRMPELLPAELMDRLLAALILRLQDSERPVRANAAEILPRLRAAAAKAVPALIAAAKDKSRPNEKIPMALALVDSKNPEVIPLLLGALDDPDAEVREQAAQALFTIQRNAPEALSAPAVVAALIDQAKQGHDGAIWILGELGPAAEPAVPVLINSVRRDHKAAIRALGDIGPAAKAAVPVLIESAKQGYREAVEALGGLGPAAQGAVPFLLKQAQSSKWKQDRKLALEALVSIAPGNPEVLAIIVRNLKHPGWEDGRAHALEMLGKLGPRARSTFPEILKIVGPKTTYSEFKSLIEALDQIGLPHEQRMPVIRRGLQAKDDSARKLAVEEVLKQPPVDGTLLAKFLVDEDPVIRWTVLEYVSQESSAIDHGAAMLPALAEALLATAVYSKYEIHALVALHRFGIKNFTLCDAVLTWERENSDLSGPVPLAEVKAKVCP